MILIGHTTKDKEIENMQAKLNDMKGRSRSCDINL